MEFGEVNVFIGPGLVVAVRHAENSDPANVRRLIGQNPALLLALGSEDMLHAVLDEVVHAYSLMVAEMAN